MTEKYNSFIIKTPTHQVINRLGDVFVDDTAQLTTPDLTQNSQHPSHITTTICHLIKKSETIAQDFEKKLTSTGGKLALTKCFWYLITWEWTPSGKASMAPINRSPGTISLTSGQNTTKTDIIKRAEITEPYRTIGSYQTPTGSMEKEIMIKKEQIENWGQPLQTSKIYPNLVYKAYKTILMPQITFSLTNTTLTLPEINNLQTKADKYYIPKLGMSSKFPQVVLRGSYKFGGFNQTTLQMSQIYKQLQMIIGCTRDQNDTGTLLECSINITQLEAGVTTPILSAETTPDFINYTT